MQDVILRHVAHGGAVGVEVVVERGAVDEHFAVAGGLEAAKRAEQGALAGAAGAHDGHELIRVDGERDILEEVHALGDLLVQADDVEADIAGLVVLLDALGGEYELHRADADLVAGGERARRAGLHGLAVHIGAVGGPQVFNRAAAAIGETKMRA